MALYGRHGESPLPIVAAHSPAHCFDAAIEAARIALKYRTPVILLSDGYLANGTEPWRLPDVADAARHLAPPSPPSRTTPTDDGDAGVLALPPRPRDAGPAVGAARARPASMHRIGGLEKEDGSRQRQLRLRPTTSGWSTCGRPRSPGSPTTSRDVEVEGDPTTPSCSCSAGARPGAPSTAPSTGCGPPAARWPRPTSSTSTRSRRTWARSCAATRKVLVPEMNLGQLVPAGPGRVPRRRPVGHQGAGRALHRRRARAGDPRHPRRPRDDRRSIPVTTRKDWSSDQEVRWCPGCGDYSILTAVQLLMPELGVRREDMVFVSGIGCAARFPYYMNTYGMHSIHGRAPAIATGLAMARPDLARVGRHRRRRRAVDRRQPPHPRPAPQRQHHDPAVQQPDLRADQGPVLAHQRGSARSPSRRRSAGSTTRSTRCRLALGAEATFVARTHDMDRDHMMETFRRAHEHKGAAFVEVYQNCNVFNDGAFEGVTAKADARRHAHPAPRTASRSASAPRAEHGVVIDAQRGARDRRRRRRRRGRAARARRGPRRTRAWPSCCPGSPRGPYEPTPDRRVPGRRAPRVRLRGRTASSPTQSSPAVPATWPACSAAAPPGRSAA